MAVPKFDALMLPLLQLAADGREHRFNDAVEGFASTLNLSDADRAERIPSGQSRLRNRTYWAKFYLSKAKALDTVSTGIFRITERGRELLAGDPSAITHEMLLKYPEYRAFREKSRPKDSPTPPIPGPDTTEPHSTPEDALQAAYDELKEATVSDLLEAVRAKHWTFLEKLVVPLLEKMNYGAGDVLGGIGVHEGGIDGVIRKDRLGLGRIYFQAKRYKDGSAIGAPALQQFVGSMKGRHSEEGVFVTTSTFTKEAKDYARTLGDRVALIDGQRLAELMYELGIGVSSVAEYRVKRIDSDFFAED